MPHINITFFRLPCTQVFCVYASHRYNMPNYYFPSHTGHSPWSPGPIHVPSTALFPLFIHISYCNDSLVLHWNNLLSIFNIQNIFLNPTYSDNFFYLFSSLSKGRGILPLISHTYIILKIKYYHNLFFQTILIFEQFSIPFSNNFNLRTILNTLFLYTAFISTAFISLKILCYPISKAIPLISHILYSLYTVFYTSYTL